MTQGTFLLKQCSKRTGRLAKNKISKIKMKNEKRYNEKQREFRGNVQDLTKNI